MWFSVVLFFVTFFFFVLSSVCASDARASRSSRRRAYTPMWSSLTPTRCRSRPRSGLPLSSPNARNGRSPTLRPMSCASCYLVKLFQVHFFFFFFFFARKARRRRLPNNVLSVCVWRRQLTTPVLTVEKLLFKYARQFSNPAGVRVYAQRL